jgi:hypothetical protein
MRRSAVIAAVATGVLVAGGAVYYAVGAPPFGEDATVSASRLCPQLGPAARAAEVLNEVLPEAGSYTLDAETTVRRAAETDGYAAGCRIRDGEKRLLLTANTELQPAEPVESWFSSVRGRDYPDGGTRPFGPGDTGRSSARAAAILVPCAPADRSPQGARSLGVTVRLPAGARPEDAEEARAAVRELALAVARQSHRDAGCDLPSGLPE